jgi:Flp pilus assembly protein CpaB
MKSKHIVIASYIAASFAFASVGFAHCDSLDGPVIADAQRAIEAKDVTPVSEAIHHVVSHGADHKHQDTDSN